MIEEIMPNVTIRMAGDGPTHGGVHLCNKAAGRMRGVNMDTSRDACQLGQAAKHKLKRKQGRLSP